VPDPIMNDSYSRNAGLALNADLTLMLRHGVYRLASVLERGVYRLASVLERGAAQTCV